MQRNKIGLFILIIVFLVGMLAGCGDSTDRNSETNAGTDGNGQSPVEDSSDKSDISKDDLYTEPGQMPIVNERIELTIFAPGDGEFSRDENLQTKELEDMTGIDIVWEIAPGDNIKEKMNLMFSSDEMTDIVMLGVGAANRLDKATEALLGAQGFIIPLNNYFDTISVGYKNAFEELPGFKEYITTPDGSIYNLPNVDGSLHVQYNCKLWLNTKWLDELDLNMPTTTDEFYDVMKAFKEKDANGNGDLEDEIPLSTVKSGAGTQIDGFLMNPFQISPEDSRLYVDNGKVTFAPVQEGYKEGLKYLNKMYKEGLINPESFTQEKDNQVNMNEGGEETVIGAFLAQRPGYACDLSSMPNSDRWEEYQTLPPLKGPSGETVAAWNPYVMYQTGMTFITSSCEYPEAAFRFIDYLATPEGSRRSAHGVEGVHWKKAEEGELGIDGEQAIVTPIEGVETDNTNWGQLAGLVRLPKDTVAITIDQDPYGEDVHPLSGRQLLFYRGSLEHEKVKQPLESVMPDLYMSENVSEEMSLLKTTIMDHHSESLVRFITGDLDIDKDWDNYIKQLESLGLEQYLDMLQEAYNESEFAN